MTSLIHARRGSFYLSVSKSLFRRLAVAYPLWVQRRALSQLDDLALEDIGVSRSQADAEASRPLWDVPARWLR